MAKKEENMQTITQSMKTPVLPKSTKHEKKAMMQAEINMDLRDAVKREIKSRKLTDRQVVEWGLKAFLLSTNPKEAARLGITTEDE